MYFNEIITSIETEKANYPSLDTKTIIFWTFFGCGGWLNLEFIKRKNIHHPKEADQRHTPQDQLSKLTLQEMCCGFLLSREMWYRKSVLPGTGAG